MISIYGQLERGIGRLRNCHLRQTRPLSVERFAKGDGEGGSQCDHPELKSAFEACAPALIKSLAVGNTVGKAEENKEIAEQG